MPYGVDPHRIDSASYRPPGQRNAPDPAPVFTVNGQQASATGPTMNAEQPAGHRPAPSDSYSVPIQPQPTTVTGGDVAQRAFSMIQNANNALRDHLGHIGRQVQAGFLTEAGIQVAIGAFANSEFAKQVEHAEQMTDEWVAGLAAKRDQIRARLVQNGDTAAELRNQRTWDRHQRLLDSAADTGHVAAEAKRAIDNASPSEIGVFAQEFPSYLESRDVPAGWFETALAQKVPELGDAERELAQVQKVASALKYDARTMKNAIQKGSPATQLVDPKVVR